MFSSFHIGLLGLSVLECASAAPADSSTRGLEDAYDRKMEQARKELTIRSERGSGAVQSRARALLNEWKTCKFELLEADRITLTIAGTSGQSVCERPGVLPKGHSCVCTEWMEYDTKSAQSTTTGSAWNGSSFTSRNA